MRKKFAIVSLSLMMGLSIVACSKESKNNNKDNASAKPSTSAAASASPGASAGATEKESVYSQEQELMLQNRDLSDLATVGEYKGVSVEKSKFETKITDQDVEDAIAYTIDQNKTYKDTDKDYKAAMGDQVVIDFVGKKDGIEFEGGSAKDQTSILGDKTYIDDFEKGIVGHKAGTTFDINVTFPTTYGNTELAGKDVVFTITLDSIKNTIIPELNDAFVQKVSKTSKTVAEYKKEVKQTLETSAKETEETNKEDAVWDAVLQNVTVKEYPEDLVEYYAYKSKVQMTTQLATSYGISLEDYLKNYAKISEEEFNKQTVENAKAYLKQLMALQAIAKKEKLEVTSEQYQTELKKVLESNNLKTEDELKAKYGELTQITIRQGILYDNVTKFLVDNAKYK